MNDTNLILRIVQDLGEVARCCDPAAGMALRAAVDRLYELGDSAGLVRVQIAHIEGGMLREQEQQQEEAEWAALAAARRTAVLAETCSTCGAAPGRRCRSKSGRPATNPHAARRTAAGF